MAENDPQNVPITTTDDSSENHLQLLFRFLTYLVRQQGIGLLTGAVLGAGGMGYFQVLPLQGQRESVVQAIPQRISLADYERVKLDMSLTDVQSVLGPGTETSRSATKATFTWKNSNGSGITAIFEKDRLKSKEQTDLK